jgi:hypothetical protein
LPGGITDGIPLPPGRPEIRKLILKIKSKITKGGFNDDET